MPKLIRLEISCLESKMISKNEYVKKILQQILDSIRAIEKLSDKSGDLNLIKRELLKIIGFFMVLVKKLGTEDFQSNELLELKSKVESYLQNYYFIQEIDTMSPLYSDDSDRIKNMRLKILESFEDKKLIDKLKNLVEKL
ncbi:MAG: hypothetical protein OEL77_03280 [Nitrosopumilus sp.]|nr:hypothetical protein [Nitrosopumilus sp.]MDH3385019.1 hypothetical protein [Nitrosopumilus sp.]